jgi:hypothetical protein
MPACDCCVLLIVFRLILLSDISPNIMIVTTNICNMSRVRIGTPKFSKYLELRASNPQQKNAPMVYGSHKLLAVTLFLLLSNIIKAENNMINKIAITALIVSGAVKI